MTTYRLAIVHDYLTQRGGAERVLLAMAAAFPEAEIHTTLYQPKTTYEEFRDLNIQISPLNRIKTFRNDHRLALPLLPLVTQRLVIDADVVIASSTGWAHGVTTTGRKLVYCHTPARWLHEQSDFLGENPSLHKRMALRALTPALRRWDQKHAASAHRYLAISTVIQERIRRVYGINADVLRPPTSSAWEAAAQPVPALDDWLSGSDYYLTVSRLMPYKHVDQVINAFRTGRRKLVVVGAGPEERFLKSVASENVVMLSDLPDAQLHALYLGCKGLIGASHEDFGLTPLEAAQHGKACVLLRRGGYLETMVEGVTCEFFDRPQAPEIAGALDRFEQRIWDSGKIKAHAESFGAARFATELRAAVENLLP